MGTLLDQQLNLLDFDLDESQLGEMSGTELLTRLEEIYAKLFNFNHAWPKFKPEPSIQDFDEYLLEKLNSSKKVLTYKSVCLIFYLSSRYYQSIIAWIKDSNRKESIRFGGDILEPEMLFSVIIFLVFNVLKRHEIMQHLVFTPDIESTLTNIEKLYREYNVPFGNRRTNKIDSALIRENIYSTKTNYPFEYQLMVSRFAKDFQELGIDIFQLLDIKNEQTTSES